MRDHFGNLGRLSIRPSLHVRFITLLDSKPNMKESAVLAPLEGANLLFTKTRLAFVAGIVAILIVAAMLVGNVVGASSAFGVPVTTNATTGVSNNTTQTMSIPVTAGLRPTRITGTISAPQATNGTTLRPGTVVIAAGGQPVHNGPARAATFSQVLRNPAVVRGNLEVVVTYNVPTLRGDFCADASQQIDISNIKIDFTGRQSAPTTVASFLTKGTNGVNVLLPENPSEDLIQAGLAAVGAATNALEPSAQVRMSLGSLDPRIRAIPGARVISFSEAANPVRTSINSNSGLPQLNITGSGDELAHAASALGGTNIPLAGSAQTEGLSQNAQPTLELTKSFQSLGVTNPTLSGWGNQSLFIGADQSTFGSSISDATVRVVGTHSAIPNGATATMNLYWNDSLIASQVLDTDTSIDLTASVPNAYIQNQNGLRVVMTAVPQSGNCTGSNRFIPIKLSLDGKQSQITANQGQTLTAGFQRFPQVLGGVLPVAFADGAPISQTAIQAALLVASLQRANQEQLLVNVVPLSEVVGTSSTALVVGADDTASNDLQAPLRLTEFRTVSTPVREFEVGLGIPYAALEAFATGNRNLIMLGAWYPNDVEVTRAQEATTALAENVYSRSGGWFSLGADILLTQPDFPPVQLDSNSVVPQPAVTEEYSVVVWWVLGVTLLFLALAAWRFLSVRRTRKKIAKYVDAQEAVDQQKFGEADEL